MMPSVKKQSKLFKKKYKKKVVKNGLFPIIENI